MKGYEIQKFNIGVCKECGADISNEDIVKNSDWDYECQNCKSINHIKNVYWEYRGKKYYDEKEAYTAWILDFNGIHHYATWKYINGYAVLSDVVIKVNPYKEINPYRLQFVPSNGRRIFQEV